MNQERKLLKNTAIVTFGKICTQLISFFLLPIYTAVLTKSEYGIVDLLHTLTNLFLPIITLQIDQGIFRYLIDYRDNKEKQTSLITTIFRFLFIQIIIYIVLFLCVSPLLNNEYKYFLSINLIICMFSSILLQISRGLGDNKRYAIGSFIAGVLSIILNLVFIVGFRWGAYGMILATIIGNLVCTIYIFISKKIFSLIDLKKYDKNLLKEVLRYSMPLIPNIISWWIVNTSDRLIVAGIIGIAQNGIYSVANKFSHVFISLYNVFNLTWTESASVNINSEERDKFFSKILDITIRIFGSIALGIIALLPFAFRFLVNESYNDAYVQIPILMIASVFNILVSFLGSIYVAKKITKEIAKTSMFAAIINIAVNLCLIKFVGLYAASISTLVAYLTMFIYRAIDSRKYVKLSVNKSMIISMTILTIATTLIYYMQNKIFSAIIAIIVTIYAIYINRNSAKFIIQAVKSRVKNR